MDDQRMLYREEFKPVIAEPLFEYCLEVAGRAAPMDADKRVPLASGM